MPVPSAITDLSQTAGSNSPAGSESPALLDDHIRTVFAFIAKLRDGQGLSAPVDLASAATTDIGAQTSPIVRITGTTTITSFGANYAGPRFLTFAAALTLTHNATSLILPGGANITTAAGDCCIAVPNLATPSGWRVIAYQKANGAAVLSDLSAVTGTLAVANGGTGQTTAAAARAALEAARDLQPISASVGSNALTLTLNPTNLDFRSATLGSGTVNTRTVSAAISLVISSGSTLGTSSGVPSRLAVLAIDNAGTVELAVVNLAGAFSLDESGLISTTAEGGAGGADSASTIYSTTARSNVPYRVVGYVESTQATAGTWATAPSKIQGAGGRSTWAIVSAIESTASVSLVGLSELDFDNIPAKVRRIGLHWRGGSSSGTSNWMVRLGTASAFAASGYVGSSVLASNAAASGGVQYSSVNGVAIFQNAAAVVSHGSVFLERVGNTNTWQVHGGYSRTDTTTAGTTQGYVPLSGPLTRVKFATANLSDTFDGSSEISMTLE